MRPYVGKMREVRKVAPPGLQQVHMHEKIFSHHPHPVQSGIPTMHVEQQHGKVITHNYGHQEGGWTLAPSFATYVNGLLLDSPYSSGLGKETPITVLGAGMLGLFTAYDLVQRGFENITIVAEKIEALPSHHAGALLTPVVTKNNVEMQKIVGQIGIDAYSFFESIAKGKNPDFKEGASLLSAYFESREQSGLESHVGTVMQPAKDVTLDFGNGTTRDMVAYDDAIYIDTVKMMAALHKHLKGKAMFEERKVTSFSDLRDSFIINCTGLGSAQFDGSHEAIPPQGHSVMLKNQKAEDMRYVIVSSHGDGKDKRSFYMYPKQLPGAHAGDSGVIGGIVGEGADKGKPHEQQLDSILHHAKDFFGTKLN